MNRAGGTEYGRLSRRSFLSLGGAAFFGLTMPHLFAGRARAATTGLKARAKQIVMVWLEGGPSQADMFDLKPDSKKDVVRPLFQPIQTRLPGLLVSELMPKLAGLADRYTIIRSFWVGPKGPFSHFARERMVTLSMRDRGRNSLAYPTPGSVIAKVKGGPADLPPYIALGYPMDTGVPGVYGTFLGPAYEPLVLGGRLRDGRTHPVAEMLAAPNLDVPAFERQTNLVKLFDRKLSRLDDLEPVLKTMDQHRQKAYDMLRSPKLRGALDLSKEDPKVVERYGHTGYEGQDLNQNLLIARRLLEAGVPSIFVEYPNWDWHGHKENLSGQPKLVPHWDQALSAFLEDLEWRGMLDETIVLVMGEQGRGPLDRSHWSGTQFAFLAGGGFAKGRVVGATDADNMRPIEDECFPEDLAATLYHQLGIDPHDQLLADGQRPVRIVDKDDFKIIHKALA